MSIPIKIHAYNTGLSLYENSKGNLMADRLAQNRWGNTFKKYYRRHKEPTASGVLGAYNFTQGMRATVSTLTQTENDLSRTNAFLAVFNNKMDAYGALGKTSAKVVVRTTPLSFGAAVPTVVIEKITFSFTETFPAGYVDWVNNSSELAYFLGLLAKGDAYSAHKTVVVVDISFVEFKSYLEEHANFLNEGIDTIENTSTRTSEDLELIGHLGIEETLASEIKHPGDIQKIWFEFKQKVSPPPPDPNHENEVYKWWKDEKFQTKKVKVNGKTHTIYGIADAIKDFQNYCVFDGYTARLKPEVFDLPGWKVYWFVNTFLKIDANAKKKSLLLRIFDFVVLIIAVYLTLMGGNPVWLKVIIIATQIGAYLGIVPPKIALYVSVLSFGYGALSTNFSAMSSMQVFSWAMSNVEQIFKMVQMYKTIAIQEQMEQDAKDANANKSLVQQQDEAMEFIYNHSNDQYEEMVTALYDFSPKQKYIES